MAYLMLWSQFVVVGVFLVAVVAKVRRRATFAGFVSSVDSLRLLPRRLSRPVAYAVLAAEMVVIPLAAIPATAPFGLAGSALMLAAFTVAVVFTRAGKGTTCWCFGPSTTRLGWPHVLRNLTLMAICGAGLWAGRDGDGVSMDPLGAIAALVAAATVVLLATRLDDLVVLLAAR